MIHLESAEQRAVIKWARLDSICKKKAQNPYAKAYHYAC